VAMPDDTKPGRRSLAIEVAGRTAGNSPLRYPGGKAALSRFFSRIISELGMREACYIEPYAGGVGAGVALLRDRLVEHLVINDIDPAVYCFWKSVTEATSDSAELIRWTPTSPLRCTRGVGWSSDAG